MKRLRYNYLLHVPLGSDFSHLMNETKISIESIPNRLMNETGMKLFKKLLLFTILIRGDLILRFPGYIHVNWFARTFFLNKMKRTKINRTQLYGFFLDFLSVNKDVIKDLYTTIHLLGKFFHEILMHMYVIFSLHLQVTSLKLMMNKLN